MGKLKDYDHNRYQRTYREKHPEKVLQWRLNQYTKKLKENGWKVEPPENNG